MIIFIIGFSADCLNNLLGHLFLCWGQESRGWRDGKVLSKSLWLQVKENPYPYLNFGNCKVLWAFQHSCSLRGNPVLTACMSSSAAKLSMQTSKLGCVRTTSAHSHCIEKFWSTSAQSVLTTMIVLFTKTVLKLNFYVTHLREIQCVKTMHRWMWSRRLTDVLVRHHLWCKCLLVCGDEDSWT